MRKGKCVLAHPQLSSNVSQARPKSRRWRDRQKAPIFPWATAGGESNFAILKEMDRRF